jgi:large subunit ribosomal protein L13
MKTIFVNPKEVERKWYVIDAAGIPLGKVAEKAAVLLQGKHKPIFVRHQEIGDYVLIINADKVDVTGNKRRDKMYHRHTGYPGGIRSENFATAIKRNPVFPVEHAVRGMLPKNRIGRKQFTNMKVYAGTDHPHAAQKPEPIAFG